MTTVLPLAADDAEEAVLCAVLHDNATMDRLGFLTPDDFADPGRRELYATMRALHAEARAIDPITLAAELTVRGTLERIGGNGYIGALLYGIPTAASATADEYARIVQDRAQRRELRTRMSVVDAALAHDSTATEAATRLRDSLDRFLSATAPRRLRILDDNAIQELPPPAFLVDGLVPERSQGMLYGAPGSFKSFAALGLALSVASGINYYGRQVRRAPVVYVAAEGFAGLGARVCAWKAAHGITGVVGALFVGDAVNLMDHVAVSQFIREVQSTRFGEGVGLVVIDTLHRSMPGGDENSQRDAGLVIDGITTIVRQLGATVLVVHHTNLAGERERGSTAFRGAMEFMVSVKRDAGSDTVTLTNDKQKDAEEAAPMSLRAAARDGSLVLDTITDTGDSDSQPLSQNHRKALTSLSTSFLADGASASQWKAVSGLAEATFYRIRTDLVTWGYVHQGGNGRAKRYTIAQAARDLVAINSQSTITSLSASRATTSTLTITPGGFLETPAVIAMDGDRSNSKEVA